MVTLVCGVADEAPIALLLESLRKTGGDLLFLDQREFASNVELRWQLSDSGLSGGIRSGTDVVDIREIRSVYHRFANPEEVSMGDDSPQAIARCRSILHSLMNLFDIMPARVVNRRRPMMSNNSKPYQMLLIHRAGLSAPETLITNDPVELLECEATRGPLIYKSMSSVRSVVSPFASQDEDRLGLLGLLPTQFQRKIEGINIRVHVIGRRLLATKIVSEATDYRYAFQQGDSARFTPYELTEQLRHGCLRLARICDLSFAGIDLMVAPDGVYFLEINPAPGYSYYQEATGQPISDALAEYLTDDSQPPVWPH